MKFNLDDRVIASYFSSDGCTETKHTGVVKEVRQNTCTVEVADQGWSWLDIFPNNHLSAFPILSKDSTAQKDQWDESLRGKKMSNNYGKVIYKYQMPIQERFSMTLPKGTEILRVADQDGMFWMWAVVDTNAPDEERQFVAVKCGANVPDDKVLTYIGMCAIFVQQELALYIFEDITDYA